MWEFQTKRDVKRQSDAGPGVKYLSSVAAQSELIYKNGEKEDLCQWETYYPYEDPSDGCDNISNVGMLIRDEDIRAGLCLPARWWVQNIDNKYSSYPV